MYSYKARKLPHCLMTRQKGTATLCGRKQGIARILGKGVLDYEREVRAQNFKPHPLINWEDQSSNCHRDLFLIKSYCKCLLSCFFVVDDGLE